jgi:hypothetical protein
MLFPLSAAMIVPKNVIGKGFALATFVCSLELRQPRRQRNCQ